jgi:hypothetical protein
VLDRLRSFFASFSSLAGHLPTRSQAIAAGKVAALWAVAFALSAVVARSVATRVDTEVILLVTAAVAVGVFGYELYVQVEKATPPALGPSPLYTNFEAARDAYFKSNLSPGKSEPPIDPPPAFAPTPPNCT